MRLLGLFGKPSPDQFVRLLLNKAKAAGAPHNFDYNRESFTLKQGRTLLNLSNVYENYCRAKGDRKEVLLNNFIGAMTSTKEDFARSFEEARGNLVAVVRERSMLGDAGIWWQLEFKEEATKDPVANEPISAWFTKAVVIDAPTHTTLVTEKQFSEWGITFAEGFALGLENLRGSTVPKFDRQGGLFIGSWKDDYDASRVLLPELFARLELDGDPVLSLPNRLTLLVAGSNDETALHALLEKSEEITGSEPQAYNTAPLLIRGGELWDFEVEPASPLFHPVQRAKKLAALSYYAGQKKLLEKLYADRGKDYFVASYALSHVEKRGYVSSCAWTKDVPTLLPESDVVRFVDTDRTKEEGAVVATAPWNRVKAILGDHLLDTKMFPPRHFVSRFPSEDELERLRYFEVQL